MGGYTKMARLLTPSEIYEESERRSKEAKMVGTAEKRTPRVGDKYDIPVEVVSISTKMEKAFRVQVRGNPNLFDWVCGASLEASRLVEAAPEPLKVGDPVQTKRDGIINPSFAVIDLRIKAIHNQMAWIVDSGYEDRSWVVYLKDLRKVGV